MTLLLLSLLHGATFLMLKTTGEMRGAVRRRGPHARCGRRPSAMLAFVIWTRVIAAARISRAR